MDGVSGVGGMAGGGYLQRPSQATGAEQTLANQPQQNVAGASVSAAQSVQSMSSTSVTASSESFIGTFGGALSNEDLLGAILLLLVLEYMQSDDEEEKKGLLELMTALAQQGGGGGDSGVFMYQSSFLSIESTQMQAVSMASGVEAYGGSMGDPQQVMAGEPGSHLLDAMA